MHLRAQGKLKALINEPRISDPCDLRFFPHETGNMAALTILRGGAPESPLTMCREGQSKPQGSTVDVKRIDIPQSNVACTSCALPSLQPSL